MPPIRFKTSPTTWGRRWPNPKLMMPEKNNRNIIKVKEGCYYSDGCYTYKIVKIIHEDENKPLDRILYVGIRNEPFYQCILKPNHYDRCKYCKQPKNSYYACSITPDETWKKVTNIKAMLILNE